ncbi:hypothetical protein MVEN_00137800 [Mycena venus]|uniref:Uncharacterized protein n=1 Tax=Mycena venus TaxID=2733690 RepID=A0A8H7DCT6_9AGAR|nr:hypothetical protein MVEN_00137800 [Mycena venus]
MASSCHCAASFSYRISTFSPATFTRRTSQRPIEAIAVSPRRISSPASLPPDTAPLRSGTAHQLRRLDDGTPLSWSSLSKRAKALILYLCRVVGVGRVGGCCGLGGHQVRRASPTAIHLSAAAARIAFVAVQASEDADFVPYASDSCICPRPSFCLVIWAVAALAGVGRAGGVGDARQGKASRASPATLRFPSATTVFLLVAVRASDQTDLAPHTALLSLGSDARSPRSRQEGGRRRWIGYSKGGSPSSPECSLSGVTASSVLIPVQGGDHLGLISDPATRSSSSYQVFWSAGAFVGVGGTRGGDGGTSSSTYDPAHCLPRAVRRSRQRHAHRRTSLFRLHDLRRRGLSWGLQTTPPLLSGFSVLCFVSQPMGLGAQESADSGVHPHIHPLRATEPQLQL